MVLESRGIISDIQKTRQRVESFGGVFQSHYTFTNTLYVLPGQEPDFDKEFIRLRIYPAGELQGILVQKKTELQDDVKTSHVVFKKEFYRHDNPQSFLRHHFGDSIAEVFSYSREGWHYKLPQCDVFVEDVASVGASVEIEAPSARDIDDLLVKLGVTQRIYGSMPNFVNSFREK